MHQQGYQPRLTITDKFNLFAGVILPGVAVTIEASTHMCAQTFFDPIPTVWHMMLVLFVPLAQLHVWFAIRRGVPERLMLAGFVNAVVIGISIFYSLAFLKLAPVAFLTTFILVGLLPLSPILSLITALVMRQRLRQIAATASQPSFALRIRGLLAALGLTFGLIGLIELPAALTRYGLQMASSSSPVTRSKGIRFLRNNGSEEQMLLSCYSRNGTTSVLSHLLSIENPVSTDEARKIYYRVTGETFDMSVPPRRVAGRLISQEDFDFENDQGGTRIGGKVKGLSLSSSILGGDIDADGGVAYLEWVLAFRNDSESLRVARAEIQLPPGGVVSRVALWRNDEEREAVFGNRIQLGREYQKYQLYQHASNPVLVTTAGRDRILVQGSNVPPFGGEIKIRLGITVPLVLESRNHVRLLLPHFEGRNFRIPDSLTHSVWFDSTRPIGTEYGGLYYDQMPDGRFTLGGQLTDKQLSKPERSLLLSRLDSDAGTWSENPFAATVVKQWIEERAPVHLRRIVLVIDTSASMAKWESEINTALGALPRDVDVQLVLADNDFFPGRFAQPFMGSGLTEISGILASASFTGGADNAPALSKAWNLAAEVPGNNAIVWIHSPQLVNLESVETLRERWERRPYGPLLYSVQTSKGSDEIMKRLDGIDEVKSVVRMGTLRADLERLFGQLSGRIKTFEFVRSVESVESIERNQAPTNRYKASDHVAKLWANDEIVRMLNKRDETLKDAATGLATRYQLVTPVSSATVVDMAGHYPYAEVESVDTEPPLNREPEVETLFLASVLFVIALIFIKYRHAGSVVNP